MCLKNMEERKKKKRLHVKGSIFSFNLDEGVEIFMLIVLTLDTIHTNTCEQQSSPGDDERNKCECEL